MTLKMETRQVDGVTVLSCQGRIVFGEEVFLSLVLIINECAAFKAFTARARATT